jgi:hypothetical protein
VPYIRRDDHAAARDFIANGFDIEVLPLCDIGHLLGYDPVSGVMHLRSNGIIFSSGNPFGAHIVILPRFPQHHAGR